MVRFTGSVDAGVGVKVPLSVSFQTTEIHGKRFYKELVENSQRTSWVRLGRHIRRFCRVNVDTDVMLMVCFIRSVGQFDACLLFDRLLKIGNFD